MGRELAKTAMARCGTLSILHSHLLGRHAFSHEEWSLSGCPGQRIVTGKGKERVFRITVRPSRTAPTSDQMELELEPKPQTKGSVSKWKWEIRAFGTAFLFSMMSVFNIGFREFNFGRWIRMLQFREFNIRARGWMRTVSGIQSLIGVALLALSLLSYFGHPFD
jgi:hypothetical protein